MKKLLIVDDDPDVVMGLQECLTHTPVKAAIFTAPQAEDALKILTAEKIDLLITDVHMPGMSGMELVVEAKSHNPHLSVIVATAYPNIDIEKQAMLTGCLRFIEKPFDFAGLIETVNQALADKQGFAGTVDGIDLQDLIQLHCLSGSTAAVKVCHDDETGMIFFEDGKIVHAIMADIVGEEAFYQIMAFTGGSLESTKGVSAPVFTIKKDHMALLMEGVRRLDEAVGKKDADDDSIDEDWFVKGCNLVDDGTAVRQSGRYFAEFKKVLGYRAAAILTLSGEMLASESLDADIDLDNVAVTLNDIYREAHEAINKIGMDRCIETVIEASNGVIVMHSTGDDSNDLHVIGVLAAGGNKSLLKMKMARMIPAIKEFYAH